MRECKKQIITFASRDVGDRLAHVVTGPSQAGDVRLQLSHLHVLSGNTLQQDPAGRHMRQTSQDTRDSNKLDMQM